VFVFNDERLGMVEAGDTVIYGRTPLYPTTPMDVCSVAAGLGAHVLRVHQPGQLLAAAQLLRTAPGPVVVDVRIDPDIIVPKLNRIAATMAPGGPPKPRRAN
jgi:acetolactate synthase I/II/III large subunit